MVPKKIYGIILGIKPLGELDRFLVVFSREYGMISIAAKGVKKITSHRGFHLDLLNMAHLDIEEVGIDSQPRRYLREVSTENPFSILKTNPESFSSACVIATFLKRLLPENTPQKKLFDLTKKTFEVLNTPADPKEVVFTYFLKTLRLLGHLPIIIKKRDLKPMLQKALTQLDPEFTLNARRTLGIFSKFESMPSS